MNTYHCILSDNNFQKENFFRNGDNAVEVLQQLQDLQFGKGGWKIYLDDELEVVGRA